MKEPKRSKVFVVYQTDAWLSVCSYVLMGVFGTKDKAIHAIITKGEWDADWIEGTGDDQEALMAYVKEYLENNLQTPSCGLTNYIIKVGTFNEWEELV